MVEVMSSQADPSWKYSISALHESARSSRSKSVRISCKQRTASTKSTETIDPHACASWKSMHKYIADACHCQAIYS